MIKTDSIDSPADLNSKQTKFKSRKMLPELKYLQNTL